MSEDRFDVDSWAAKAAIKYVNDAIGTLSSSDSNIKKAAVQVKGYIKAANFLDKVAEINSHDEWPEETRDALAVIQAAHIMRGSPIPGADIPLTFEQAWAYVNDLPEFIGPLTKEEFMQYLEEKYPDIFQRDPLTTLFGLPAYLNDPQGLDPSDLEGPLVPVSLPQPGSLTPFLGAPNAPSPLVLDLDGDGVELTTYNDTTTTTFFDIDGDGFAQRTAWVGADDGLLARDLDESGAIESVEELFGSPSVDGFALLATLDDNGDHVIDQYDDVWSDLVIWKDANGDAVSQSNELHTLSSLNIVSIDLAGVTQSSSTISGNPISHTTTYTISGGSTRAAVDAWFVSSRTSTYDIEEYTLDEAVVALPGLRGSGQISDLFIAMSRDEDLFDLVRDFTDNWDISRFEDGAALDTEVADILWKWAGVDGVSPTSRGNHIDGRVLAFLEKYFAEPFLQWGTSPNPQAEAAALLNESWQAILNHSKAQLIVQVSGAFMFYPSTRYDIWTGVIEGDMDLSQDAVNELEAAAPAPGTSLVDYWEEVARYLQYTKGLDNLTGGELTMLEDAVVATDSSLSWEDIMADSIPNPGSTINGTSGNDTLNGTVGDDTISGLDGADTISGGQGHDTINSGNGGDTAYGGAGHDDITGGTGADTFYGEGGDDQLTGGDGNNILDGGDGNDTITAGTGNDTLVGGAGNDMLDGWYGNDTFRPGTGGNFAYGSYGDDIYEYQGGDDFYSDAGDTDTIKLPSGITSGNLSFKQIIDGSNRSLVITVGSLGTIETPFFTSSGGLSSSRIETLMFADTTTFNYGAMTALTSYGTDSDDVLYGVNVGSHLNDTLYGLDGNDILYGQAGNDTLHGGDGNDYLQGSSGNDVYMASPGFDKIYDDGGSDTIMLPAGYSAGDVTLFRPSGYASTHLGIAIDGLGQIIIEYQLNSGTSYVIETLSFNGASTLDLTTSSIETLGSASNDSLAGIMAGASTNDILDGRQGDDALYGNMGDDTYFFSEGDDLIGEQGGADIIAFREAWDPADISIYRRGTKLILEDQNGNSIEAGQHFTVEYGSSNASYEIEQVTFWDSTTWTLSSMEIETRGTSGSDYITGTTDGDASSADTLYGLGGNDSIYGGQGNDRLIGGAGDDSLGGEAGDDVYVFSEGLDSITEYFTGGTDTLLVTGGVTINDVTVSDYSSYHTKVVVSSGVNEVTLNYLRDANALLHVERIAFDDGFSTNLLTYNSWMKGTSGNDSVFGNGSDNTLIGFAGNDTMTGGSGNDDMHGGAGNDTLDGDDGTDLLYGGDGDDILYGEGGLDTLHGGAGADTFMFFTASAFSNVDVIRDFSAANDDVLDLTDILDTVYDPLTDDIADFISFSESSGSTFVSVDRDGTGGTYSMAQIIKLENVTGLASPETLETNGNLIAA